MESKKINQLSTELTPSLADLTIIGDPTTGISKKITLSQMAALFTGTVEEYPSFSSFPLTGVADTIYIATDTNVLYRWNTSTSAYVELSPNIISSLVFNDSNGFDGTISLVGSTATLTITTTLTSGSVAFGGTSGALSQDNSNFYWDNTNKRHGINTNAPTTTLDVFGSGIIGRFNGTSTNNAFLGFASNGTNRWSIGNVQSDHRFRIYNEATTSELATILSTGEFGIGIANPTTKFHIDGAASALIVNLDANVSIAKSISFRSDNSNRWNIEVSGTESTGNTGMDFFLRSYSDAGALIETPLSIVRSTGVTTIKSLTLTNALSAANGGTGITSYTIGDLIYASGATTLAKLADVATGNALISGGVGVAPSWGKIDLTTTITGTLPVANGGTGATTFTAGRVLFGNGTSAINTSANLFWDNTNSRLGIGTATPSTSLHVTGAVTFGGALSGTSATFSSSVSSGSKFISTAGNNNIVFESVSATTGYQYIQILNTTGHTILGTEGTAAGSLLTNGTANATVLTSVGNTNLEFGTNQVKRLTIAASTGAATFSSSVTVNGNLFVSNSTADNNSATILNTSATGYGLRVSGGQSGDNSTRYAFRVSDYQNNPLFSVYGGGNVGIGTTSPAAKFHLSGDFELGDAIRISSTYGTGRTYRIKSQGGNADVLSLLESESGNRLAFFGNLEAGIGVNGSTRLYINSSGNVGIGTASPSAPLHVYWASSANVNPTLLIEGATANNSNYPRIRLKGGTYPDADSKFPEMVVTNGGLGLVLSGGYSTTYNNPTQISLNNGTINFWTASGSSTPLERMTITSGGDVLVGTTTTDVNTQGIQLRNNGIGIFVRSGASCLQLNRLTSDGIIASFRTSDVERGSISISGSTTTYNTSSDYRLKKDFKNFNGLDIISKIKSYDFAWKENDSRMYGVIAHELQKILGYAVVGEKDGVDMQGVDYSKLTPILVKAIQEQQAQIEELKSKLN